MRPIAIVRFAGGPAAPRSWPGPPCLPTPFDSCLERRAVFHRRITERAPFALGAGRPSRFVLRGSLTRSTSPSARSTGPSWCLLKITPRRARGCLGSPSRTSYRCMPRLVMHLRRRPRRRTKTSVAPLPLTCAAEWPCRPRGLRVPATCQATRGGAAVSCQRSICWRRASGRRHTSKGDES